MMEIELFPAFYHLLRQQLAWSSQASAESRGGTWTVELKAITQRVAGSAVLAPPCGRISTEVSWSKRGGHLFRGGASMGCQQIRIVLRNDLSEIAKLHPELENFGQRCSLSSKTLFEINLILEEVLANIISYAYGDNQRHEIVVRADLGNGELVIEVEDDGRPFHPLQSPPPDLEQPLEQRKVGGLGLHLVRELTSSIEYHRKGEKNRLLVRKKIEESDPREPRM